MTKGVLTKGFYSFEKFGIVGRNTGYAVFLCSRWLKLANAVIHNLYFLTSATVNLFCFIDIDLFHKGSDDFCIKFFDIRVLLHQFEKTFHIGCFFLGLVDDEL